MSSPSETIAFQDNDQSLAETLLRAINSIDGDTVTLRRLFLIIGEQGLLVLCALLTVPFLLPVSIPGVSTVFGAAIILISIGITLNRLPWLPRFLLDRNLETERLLPVLRKGLSIVQRADRYIHRRLDVLVDGVFINRLNGAAIVFSGLLLMLPLGLIPFSNTLPALAILSMALGLSQRDGVFVLGGYVMMVLTVIYFAVLALLAVAAGQTIGSYLPF
ncbi:exopolysaccharide biosynthesis protein [Oryzicola mucosus]|uniref:Exopolysaccharide biosynthesis protein n=1 Tax=Oryzicola mucosus TaxID=2767425 RepID=A0A8J6U8S6_9HYPH|nr:exopolysaccharide biosynthesis protein [Oryzicola mucosus]MBD0416097.1 exopolysaccharide biosynthesis protein [Oryzicola mucosus]